MTKRKLNFTVHTITIMLRNTTDLMKLAVQGQGSTEDKWKMG